MNSQQPIQIQTRPPAPVGPSPPRTINKEVPVGPGPNTIASLQGSQNNNSGGWNRGRGRGRGFARGRGRGFGQVQNRGRGFSRGRGRGRGIRGRGNLVQVNNSNSNQNPNSNMNNNNNQQMQNLNINPNRIGAGFVRFGGAVFSRNYVPVQLERQQQVEHLILQHLEPNYKPLYEPMDAALKTWKCVNCGLINQLYYLKCTGCANFLSTAVRVGMLINICKTYLQGWNQYNNNQFNLSTLFASNINRIYLVTLNPNGPFIPNSTSRDQLKHCVIRIFRPDHLIESRRKQLDECYHLFQESKIGTNILAQFEIGQIEEHIDGKKIYHQKQFMNEVMDTICNKMIKIHQMKPNTNIFNIEKDTFHNKFKLKCEEMRKYINMKKDELLLEGFEFTGKDLKTIGEILTLFPHGVDTILEQFEWIEKEMKHLLKNAWWENENYLVFSHNDIFQGNIMELFTYHEIKQQMNQLSGNELDNYISNNYGGDLKIIGYDQCCYNYRYYDIANWMIELCIEYFRIIQYPFVMIDWNLYPDQEFRSKFVKNYLIQISNKKKLEEITEDDIHLFLQLIDVYGLLSDLYQGISTFVYGIISEHHGHAVVRGGKRRYDEPEQIRMDYFEYSVNRLKNYWFSKDQITGEHESDRIDPNLGYNLGPDASSKQNSWYLGYGPILQNLRQEQQLLNNEFENEERQPEISQSNLENEVEDEPYIEMKDEEMDEHEIHDIDNEIYHDEHPISLSDDDNIMKKHSKLDMKEKEDNGGSLFSNIKAGIESIASSLVNTQIQSRPEKDMENVTK